MIRAYMALTPLLPHGQSGRERWPWHTRASSSRAEMRKLTSPAPRSLELGERIQVEVHACVYENDSGLDVVQGSTYHCTAQGVWQDLLIAAGPDGYHAPWWSLGQRLLAGRRRLPTAPWFALCGQVRGASEGPFLIGQSTPPVFARRPTAQFCECRAGTPSASTSA